MSSFTIRDLLWLTLVVGLIVGWWLERTRLSHELRIERIDRKVLNALYETAKLDRWPRIDPQDVERLTAEAGEQEATAGVTQ